jgi:hypothetical protein
MYALRRGTSGFGQDLPEPPALTPQQLGTSYAQLPAGLLPASVTTLPPAPPDTPWAWLQRNQTLVYLAAGALLLLALTGTRR